jgi:hypothetical protein
MQRDALVLLTLRKVVASVHSLLERDKRPPSRQRGFSLLLPRSSGVESEGRRFYVRVYMYVYLSM